MMGRWVVRVGVLAVLCIPASGQSTDQSLTVEADGRSPQPVEVQIYLPGGETPRRPIPVTLRSSDGTLSVLLASDSHGRVTLPELKPLEQYFLIVPTDGRTYGTTVVSLSAKSGMIRVTLAAANELEPTVSARALKSPNKKAEKLYRQALDLQKRGRTKDAEERLRKAIGLDTGYVSPRVALASLLFGAKRHEEAEGVLLGVLSLEAGNHTAMLQLGIVRCMAEKFEQALEPLNGVLESEPHPASAHLYLGISLMELGRMAEAESELHEVLASTDGDTSTAHYCLGRLYGRTGRLEKSIRSFESYLAAAPDKENAEAVRRAVERMKRELQPEN